jgi:DNA-directed RNA polymerase subunit F
LNTFPELFEILNFRETQHIDRNFPNQDKSSHSSLDVYEKETKQYKLSLRISNETKEIVNLFSEDEIKEVFHLFSNYIQDIFFYEFSNLQYFKDFNRKTFEKLNSFISKNYPKLLKTDVKIIPHLFDFYLEHSFHENKFNQDCTEIYNKLAETYLTLIERKKILYESIEKIRSEIVYLQRWNNEYDRFI